MTNPVVVITATTWNKACLKLASSWPKTCGWSKLVKFRFTLLFKIKVVIKTKKEIDPKYHINSVFEISFLNFPISDRYINKKFVPASIIKNIIIYCTCGIEFQNDKLSFFVENPPVAILLIEWLIASKKFIPATFNNTVSINVNAIYINQSLFAVLLILGWILSPLIPLPGASAENNCIPPIPNNGKIAIANTIIPIPPSQWVILLQKMILSGRDSTSIITLDPVVV